MRLAVGTDEQGGVTENIVSQLRSEGHAVECLAAGAEWPEVGRAVGEAVAAGRAERGIVFCHTGTGVAMAANKVPGVRAALCADAEVARGARRWNDANVVALALAGLTAEAGLSIVDAFLEEPVDPSELPAIARVGP